MTHPNRFIAPNEPEDMSRFDLIQHASDEVLKKNEPGEPRVKTSKY